MWHTMGGRQGLIASGLWSRANIYTQRDEFLAVFGVAVEEWMPHLVAGIASGLAA